ncbi:hypothetical protein NQZ68_014671 [Dissostichus eleginoides]|nr:hypothetical protein NQZ68_014671 [Dissostichus eleginoides]
MASTTQSALEHVSRARTHLVKTLKNLSVILENLNQQGVLRDEEVSKIQAEGNDYDKNRTLLDSVTKKGEAASYEFLKIIDITRKRTLGRTSLIPEKQTVASAESKTFDLHHWISCFPFKEDTQMGNNYLQAPTPCHRYQAKLKSKAQKISKEFWTANKDLFEENSKPDLSYMSLVLDTQGRVSPSKIKTFKSKKSKMSRSKKLGTYIPKDKADISPSHLLKTDKNILLVGKSGIGKTALTHEMLKLWTEKDDKELDYMFYFDMRKISNIKSLEDLLFNEFSEPDEGKDEVLQDIKNNSDNVTLMFDGITDLSSPVVQKLVNKDWLQDSKVVLTCRPADEDHLLSEDFLRVEQCLTEEKKHMKHLIPYMCRLLTKKSPSLMEYLIPAEELKNTSNWFFKAVISTFLPLCENDESDTEDSGRILFLCQCLYESQCPEACIDLLEKVDFHLDLSEESLDPYPCCAVAYVITQSKERKIWLNLEDVTMCDSLPRQLWEIFLLSEGEMDYITLLGLDGNQLHLPVEGERKLFERAVTVLQKISKKVQICLHWEREKPDCHSLCETLLEALPNVSSLSFRRTHRGPGLQDQERCYETLKREEKQLFLDLCLRAANHIQGESSQNEVNNLISLFSFNTDVHNILLDFYQHVKTQESSAVIQKLKSVLQSAPAVWTIDLSQRKTSILLEVLRLQPEKKQVELRGCSDEESEVRTLLQCLPYISQISFVPQLSEPSGELQFFGTLFCAAAERAQQTGEKTLQLMLSVCTYQTIALTDIVSYYFKRNPQCDFLLDLYPHLKDYETETGLSVLPSLQSVLQSAPAVWIIDLSERKTPILLEVLRLQPEKKQVKLRGCSDEESEVRTLLQCLPYISQLSFSQRFGLSEGVKIFGTLLCAAAEREQQTGEKTLELLSSVCTYPTFPLPHIDDEDDEEYQCGFLLDLYSHLKDCETESGLSVLPSLQSVLQSAPAVWTIDLSQRKTPILLEVLRLQREKKQVKLIGCSDGESEVRTLLQCLPYISQLSFSQWFGLTEGVKFFGTLLCAAAEREQQTGEKTLELLSSVCTYPSFPFTHIDYIYDCDDNDDNEEYQCGFLLDLYSHLKDYETETGLSVLPSLQSVLQSAPAVWRIDLSQRKSSILLEVLRLQPEKKQVKLIGCSDEESEVRTLLQCLPYISQLSFSQRFGLTEGVKIFGTLFCAAAEREQQTGEKTLELLSSVCTYPTFPLPHIDDDDNEEYQCGFLLDLYSHLKDCETETGLSVLPSLQSVLQSAPAFWRINLSQRKTPILLEVLRLQPEKKQVKLRGCSDEESEVRTFLQCLPYISQLSCCPEFFQRVCTFISVRSREEAERLASLLQLSGFTLLLSGELPRKTCLSVGRVLQLCGSKVDLILKPRKMSVKGALALFIRTTQLHSLKLSNDMALLLCGWVRRWGVVCQVTVEELSLSPQTTQPSHRVLLKVVSSLASLLRYWAVRQLDLTEVCVPALGLTPLLLHDGPLKIKLSEKNVQQLLSLLHELQDQDLTWSFLSKVGGDLTSFSLNWELLRLLLQHPSAQTLTVNMRKNLFLQENITRLLPYLDRIVFKRPCPSFVLTAIREIYKARASPIIPSLLRSLDHVINLTCRDMSPMDCDALLYTLAHSDGVRLNLLWTSIPAWKIESILLNLDNVSQLSVDRNLLLRLVHGCAASDAQQGAAESLLRTVQHSLDLSCSSFVELPEEDQSDTLRLTAEDCRAVSTILRRSRGGTQLILQDCEVQDSGLDLLFPVLPKVKLRASKAVLLQLVSLVPVNSERDTVGRAVSLCKALEGELDLSHSSLDQRACAALALMLDFSEELTELDLSHCQLTDQLLLTLSAQLHKVQVLDLSHNNITDASTDLLLQLVSINPSIHTVRLFGNNIVYRTFLEKDKKFEIW